MTLPIHSAIHSFIQEFLVNMCCGQGMQGGLPRYVPLFSSSTILGGESCI